MMELMAGELSDQLLLREAEKRMAGPDTKDTCTQEEMMAELGITQRDLDDIEVEIEE